MSEYNDFENGMPEEKYSDSQDALRAKANEAKQAQRELKRAVAAEKKAKRAEKRANRKAKGYTKKIWATVGLACIFGIVASVMFQCSNAVVNRLHPQKEEASIEVQNDAQAEIETEDNTESNVADSTDGTTADENGAEDKSSDSRSKKNPFDSKKSVAKKMSEESDDGTLTIAEVADVAMPSIVAITNTSVQELRSMYGMGIQQYEAVSAGSGIIIGQNDTELLIVTNAHVVEDADTLSVCFIDGEAYDAKVKGSDDENDLAVISVALDDVAGSTLDEITPASIGSSDDLLIGEPVVAIGNALGYGQSVTSGIVSALDRSIEGIYQGTNYIQTDAAINPGNSGGALLNMKGEVVGINSAKLANAKIEGMGYAIPISAANPILDDLMNMKTRNLVEDGESGCLGISGFSVTDEVAAAYSIPKGIYVSEVESGSAAEKAGMQKGDVIVKFDGMGMDSINKLKERLNYYKAGETVDVIIARADEGEYVEKTLRVTLDKKEAVSNNPGDVVNPQMPESDNSGNNNQRSGEFNIGGNTFQYSLPGDLFNFFNR